MKVGMEGRVEIELGDRPGANRIVVNGVDLAGVVRHLTVDAGVDRIPVVQLEVMAAQVIKANANVRMLFTGIGDLLRRYKAQHGAQCHAGAQGCVCGLDRLLSDPKVELP